MKKQIQQNQKLKVTKYIIFKLILNFSLFISFGGFPEIFKIICIIFIANFISLSFKDQKYLVI